MNKILQEARFVYSDLRSSSKSDVAGTMVHGQSYSGSAVNQRQETRKVIVQGLDTHQIVKLCDLLVETEDCMHRVYISCHKQPSGPRHDAVAAQTLATPHGVCTMTSVPRTSLSQPHGERRSRSECSTGGRNPGKGPANHPGLVYVARQWPVL